MRRLTHLTLSSLALAVTWVNLGAVQAPSPTSAARPVDSLQPASDPPPPAIVVARAADVTAHESRPAEAPPRAPGPLTAAASAASAEETAAPETGWPGSAKADAALDPADSFVMRRPGVPIELERVLRLEGQIEVDPEALAAFEDELIERDPTAAALPKDRFRREFLRRLRVTVRSTISRRSLPHVVPVAPDGSFEWACAVPAGDFEVALEPRGRRALASLPARRSRVVSADAPGTKRVVFDCARDLDVADAGY